MFWEQWIWAKQAVSLHEIICFTFKNGVLSTKSLYSGTLITTFLLWDDDRLLFTVSYFSHLFNGLSFDGFSV